MDTLQHSLPLRAVFFDYGGVIAEEGFREGFEAIAIQNGLDPAVLYCLASETVFTSRYIIGQCSESEFWEILRKRWQLGGKSNTEYVQEILTRFRLRPQMIAIVKALRSHGLATAILSDQTDWLDRLDARDHFFHYFDCILNSYHLGKSKRDPTLFDQAVQALGVIPEEALFVDNDQGNITRASSRGLQTILYRDYTRFIKELEKILSFPLTPFQ